MLRKLYNIILVMFLGILFLPVCTNALVKQLGGKSYVLEEKQYSCSIDNDASYSTAFDDKIYFTNDNNGNLYILGFDNTCRLATPNERLYYYRNYSTYVYYDWGESNGTKVYRNFDESTISAYVLTQDTTINGSKTYFINNSGTLAEVDNPTVENLSNYYESMELYYPETSTIDSNLTYYEKTNVQYDDVYIYNKVTDFQGGTAENYLVKYEQVEPIQVLTTNLNNYKYYDMVYDDSSLLDIISLKNTKYLVFSAAADTKLFKIGGASLDIGNRSIYSDSFKAVDDKLFMYAGYTNLTERTAGFEITDGSFNNLFTIPLDAPQYFVEYGGKIGNSMLIVISRYGNSTVKSYLLKEYDLKSTTEPAYTNKDLTIKFTGELNLLNKVTVDNVELEESDYTLTSGSTIVTLKNDYLKTLKSGTYNLKVEYSDGGTASVAFTVPTLNPETGDQIMKTVSIGVVSLVALVGIVIFLKKKKNI